MVTAESLWGSWGPRLRIWFSLTEKVRGTVLRQSSPITWQIQPTGQLRPISPEKRTRITFCKCATVAGNTPLERQWPTEQKTDRITLEELMVSTLAMTDALAKLMIAKGVITEDEFKAQLTTERANYLAVLRLP